MDVDGTKQRRCHRITLWDCEESGGYKEEFGASFESVILKNLNYPVLSNWSANCNTELIWVSW